MYKINNIAPDKNNFTQIVHTIDNSIKRLWYIGTLPSERRPAIAIVGTRKPTPYGKEVAYRLAHDLASQGIVVISGLALGIDGITHRAALEANGITLAVLPTSIQAIHPTAHQQLAKQIVENGGALITEYTLDETVYRTNFVARNRIVSALSDGILIVEAAARSGTLTTAGFALEQGKPVMVVPGNITSPMSEGCNNLLKQGASPVTSAKDVLDVLGLTSKKAQAHLPLAYSEEERAILELINNGVRDGEILQKQSNLQPVLFSQTLTMLEIEGKIRALGANQWTIT
jgi:DNA processing protein